MKITYNLALLNIYEIKRKLDMEEKEMNERKRK
jgi:hypothetical protein